jgi:WD40 repeat protein
MHYRTWQGRQEHHLPFKIHTQSMEPIPNTRLPDEPTITPSPPAHIQIDGYEILRDLGHGGQGLVLLAIQTATKRKVAVKLMRDGAYASPAAQRRFLREIELAAGLKHTAIVTVYQSGTTSDGRLFYVMDYVRGTPITEYARRTRPGLEPMLRLFQSVCEGVAHAHQRGVIHRDLKPSNILVDADGNPRILDFGLAKTLTTPADSLISQTGEVVGTLRYMSPEQTRGNPDELDVRSDVYSLGTILYEMTAGRSPYPTDGPLPDSLRHIAQTPAPAPHRNWSSETGVTAPRAGRCPIHQDLSTIILKSLAKERERRYQSAAEFAHDIRRYLAGEPIEARGDSSWYLLRKMASRYRLAAAAAAIVALVAAAGLIAASTAWHRAAIARDAAIAARNDASIAQRNADEQEQASRLTVSRLYSQQNQLTLARQMLLSVNPDGPVAQDWHWAAWEYLRRSHLVSWTDLNSNFPPSLRMRPARDWLANCWIDVPGNRLWVHPDSFMNLAPVLFDLNSGRMIPISSGPAPPPSAPPWIMNESNFLRNPVHLEGVRAGRRVVLDAVGYPDRTESTVALLKPDGTITWKEQIPRPGLTGVGALSADGSLLAIALLNDSIQIRSVGNSGSTVIRALEGIHDDVVAMAFDHTGQRLHVVTGAWMHFVYAVSGDTDVEQTASAHASTVRRLSFDPAGRLLVSGGYDGHVKVWDARTHQQLADVLAFDKSNLNYINGITEARFLPDGRLYSCDALGRVKVIDWRSGATTSIGTGNRQGGVAFADDGRTFYASTSNDIAYFDLEAGKQIGASFGADNFADGEANYRLIWLQNKNILIALRSPNYSAVPELSLIRCQIWDLSQPVPTLLRELRGHTDGLRDADISPDGITLVVSARDGTATLWDWQSGALLHTLTAASGHSDTSIISAVRFHPTEPVVATAGQDNRIIFWSTITGRQLAELNVDEQHHRGFGETGLLKDIAFSPDGKTLTATVGNDIWWVDLTAFDQQIKDLSRSRSNHR